MRYVLRLIPRRHVTRCVRLGGRPWDVCIDGRPVRVSWWQAGQRVWAVRERPA